MAAVSSCRRVAAQNGLRPLVSRSLLEGSYGQITEEMADCLPPPEDEAPLRAQQFADCYDQCQYVLACVAGRNFILPAPFMQPDISAVTWSPCDQ